MAMTWQPALSEGILAHCAERAPTYDRENRFFSEDFEELRAARYLLLAVPKELGGFGMSRGPGLSGATPPCLPCPRHRPGDEHASVLDRRGRRPLARRRQVPRMGLDGGRRRRGVRRGPR